MAERISSASSRRTRPVSDDAIGNFVIDKEIGKGSFAQVYSGRHKVRSLPGCSQVAARAQTR
jgi:serine/threonine-protein kinase ULK/ATG1